MIYVHIPFCKSFCTYCGFYSETASCYDAFADALLREIDEREMEIAGTLEVPTLYIGGGTPTVLPLSVLERIVSRLHYGPFKEFTIEANPEDLVEKGPGYAESLLKMGVNRVSMGVHFRFRAASEAYLSLSVVCGTGFRHGKDDRIRQGRNC